MKPTQRACISFDRLFCGQGRGLSAPGHQLGDEDRPCFDFLPSTILESRMPHPPHLLPRPLPADGIQIERDERDERKVRKEDVAGRPGGRRQKRRMRCWVQQSEEER